MAITCGYAIIIDLWIIQRSMAIIYGDDGSSIQTNHVKLTFIDTINLSTNVDVLNAMDNFGCILIVLWICDA